MNNNTELESWSYIKLCMSRHDADGKVVLEKPIKSKKTKCPLGRKIVSSPFFRSIVYHIDNHIETAQNILDYRKRDLEEYNHYVQDEQAKEDEKYRQELAREIVYWVKMVELYKTIKENKARWFKQGKFPWSGVKVCTPYFDAPPVRMVANSMCHVSKDTDLTPVDAVTSFVQMELTPVSKNGNNSKARRASRSRKRNSRSK